MATRKIGLGVMGWADMLHALGVQYDTEEAVALGKRVAEFLQRIGYETTLALGDERGCYPASGWGARRNACVTSIAPTGSISLLAGCSAGIEPYPFRRWTKQGDEGDISFGAPEGAPVATEIGWEWHVRHQAAWQEFGDSGVSKTINMPNDATREDVSAALVMAWDLGCKGTTVYRAGSREKEVQVETGLVDKDALIEELEATLPPVTLLPAPDRLERPDVLEGRTHAVRVSQGRLYVTVNTLNGRVIEILTTLGKSGSTEEAYLEAISRLVSTSLQDGGDLGRIIKQLRHISDVPTWHNGVQNKSVPDAIGQVLGLYTGGSAPVTTPAQLGLSLLCPACRLGYVATEEGCEKCYACGWTAC